ncbi:rho GTPase-activating protein 92B [Phlebotomus argentipes]|uniref:rho GTPase-activating protein 92B n=1 Tax=Phlebotomus argentipes TaxID=94469 RepID=UPI002892B2F9|nr:rho GTPase-activating protein 92B [Phlebotomus argentipes]
MMKKQFNRIKLTHFSRWNKSDKSTDDLAKAEKNVEQFKDVLEKISKNLVQDSDKEKRLKKIHEHRLGLAMEESVKNLPDDGLLKKVLENCANLEKNIAQDIVSHETNIDGEVTKRLNEILETNLTSIQKHKRNVTKLTQENESGKNKLRMNDNSTKASQLSEDVAECEAKLDKERDIWAAEMFELIAEEENIASCIINYVKYQQLYYKSALSKIERALDDFNGFIKDNKNKRIFRVPLEEHLAATNRKISYVIELCVCALLEKGLYEEGLLRVGCSNTKLKRMRSAFDAHVIGPHLPREYQDVHVIAGVLKSYLRDLPDPLLTFRLYDDFVAAAQRPTELQRKKAILNAINQLPDGHRNNLLYLTKFLSCLAQKNAQNKMSSQNIAIVMSPNLLWARETDETDYAQKVNSTAAVNTIVELLVSDWGFFFNDECDFYDSMSKDDLFPENSGTAGDREAPATVLNSGMDNMSKSMNATSLAAATAAINSNSVGSNAGHQSHSRSSSHDTSLILLGDQVKRSQSNSSLSDQSSPPQGSPKLPMRRRHNKPRAPTPPDQRAERQRSENSNHQRSRKESSSQTPPSAVKSQQRGSVENLAKPEKPPRPVMSAECQTLNRMAYKCAKAGVAAGVTPQKPVALPRTSVPTPKNGSGEVGRGKSSDEDDVVIRNSHGEKPAIPERPATLMRPISFKGSLQEVNMIPSGGANVADVKKAQSFRLSTGKDPTTLERTHIYNVDKQQVAIIDVGGDANNGRHLKTTAQPDPEPEPSTPTDAEGSGVPASPRGEQQKIKRPQIPAPPPPSAVTRASIAADSTNL